MFEAVLAEGERLARVQLNRAILRFVNGVEWLVRDPKAIVGRTPYDVVYQKDKLQVRHYRDPRSGKRQHRHAIPVLLVPPLMVKPFIFDLYPGRSLVRFLLERDFPVYLVDFGEPDRADAYVTLDNYVLDWMPAACAAAKRDAGAAEISLLGYCMGGIFALLHAAANRDDSVRNIVTIGAPVDIRKMGFFAWIAQMSVGQVELLARQIGNVPGGLSSTVFRLMTPMKNFTRYGDLFMNMWDREYMNGFDAMNQWVSQFIAYPQEAFVQFMNDFVRHNKLAKGKMRFRGRVADLRRVRAALLVFAGRNDLIAPLPAVRAVLDIVGSGDKTFRAVPGGHMGVFAGSAAPEQVWQPAADWLAAHSRVAQPHNHRARDASRRRITHDRRRSAPHRGKRDAVRRGV